MNFVFFCKSFLHSVCLWIWTQNSFPCTYLEMLTKIYNKIGYQYNLSSTLEILSNKSTTTPINWSTRSFIKIPSATQIKPEMCRGRAQCHWTEVGSWFEVWPAWLRHVHATRRKVHVSFLRREWLRMSQQLTSWLTFTSLALK